MIFYNIYASHIGVMEYFVN